MAVSNRTIRPTSKPEGEDAPSSGLPAPRRKPQQDVETFAGTAQQYVNRYSGASRNEQLQQKTSAIRSQGQAERKAETTNNDFKALQSGKPEEVQDWRQIAAMTAGLSAADDPQAQQMKDSLLWAYGEQLRPHLDVLDKDWWERNYTEPPKEEDTSRLGWKSKVGKLAPLFDYLDQWGQSSLGAIGGIEAAIDTKDDVSVGEGLRHAVRQGAAAVDVSRAIPKFDGISSWLENADDPSSVIRKDDGTGLSFDRNGDGTLNLREALGKDPDAGGRLLGAIDLIGTIAVDPSTYASMGTSSLARVGMKGVEETAGRMAIEGVEALGRPVTREMAQELNQRIMREGFKKGLDEAEQRFYISLLRSANEQAVARGGRATTRLGRDMVESQIDNIVRGGQSGLRAAGTTILPTGRLGERLGRGADNFVERVTTTPVREAAQLAPLDGRVAGDAARVADDLGQGVLDFSTPAARAVDDVVGEAQQLSFDGVRNFGFGQDAVKIEALNKPMTRYTQEMIPGIKPMIAQRHMQQLLFSTADEMQRALSGAIHVSDTIRVGGGKVAADAMGGQIIRQIVRDGRQLGMLGRIMELPGIKNVIALMSPRAGIRALLGDSVAQQVGDIISITGNAPESDDIILRMGADAHRNGLMRQSIKEFGSQKAWERTMSEALASADGRTAALAAAGPKTRQLITVMQDVRERLGEVAIAGGANPEHLRDLDSYIPRVLSDMARNDPELLQKIRNVDEIRPEMSGDRLTEGFLQARTVAENLDNLFETNSEAFRVLKESGIGEIKELFETNPVAAFAARSSSAFRAAMDIELLDGLTKITGDNGMAVGFRASADTGGKLTADQVAKGMIEQAGGNIADFRKVVLDNGEVFRIHNTIADELENVRRVFGDPKELNAFGEGFDKVNNMWARSATVFGLNPAFNIRNAVGNMFNAFISGTRDVQVFFRAAALQDDLGRISRVMRESGDDWATVARRELDDEAFEALSGARRLGVLNDGRSIDVLRENAGQANARLGNRANPLSNNFVGDAPGRALGSAVENNARLGVYLDQIAKGASPEAAAAHVKRVLFDYGDLTRFESETLRRGARFYTFMRKNTGLQAYTLAHYPARIANAEEGVQGIIDAIFGGESEHDRKLPPWMPGASIMNIPGGGQAAIGVDTPFSSFKETIELLTGPEPSDDPLARFQQESWLRGFVGRAEGLFSGVLIGTLDWIEEMESGRDSFTGRTLDPENQRRDGTLFSALATVLPGISRLETWGARSGAINEALQLRTDADGNMIGNSSDWRMALIQNFAGLQTYELSDDTDSMGRYTLISDLEDIMTDMRRDGIEVPTVEQMREAGDLAMRDRVVETLMYGWTEDENGDIQWDSPGANARLLQILPKNVRDAFVNMGVLTDEQIAQSDAAGRVTPVGGRPDAMEGSDAFKAQEDFDFAQALTAIETYLKRPLSDNERWTMVSAFGGALGVTAQENAGLNPYRENRLLDPVKSEAAEAEEQARKEDLFNRRLAAVGMTWDDALARHPRISVMQRNMENARAAGWSEEEIRTALYYAKDEGGQGWTSRADRAAINQFMTGDRNGGAVPLTTTRVPTTTDEDLQKLQTKVWNASEELRLIYQFEEWGVPSQQELYMYGVNNLTKGEQRMMGIDPLRGAPNRMDIRTDEQKRIDTEAKLGAVEQGLNAPYRWSPGNQPEYAPWDYD